MLSVGFVFFFQAEDGIRDKLVTGVQTCALPILWGIGLSLGGTTGYAINPARDLGPRIAHALLPVAGKGSSDWDYASIPILGPLVGGTLAGVALRVIGV